MNKNTFKLHKEKALIAYLDLSNMFHWQKVLGWQFNLKDLVTTLFDFPNIKNVKIYYGFDHRNYDKSIAFQKRIRKTGAILKTKPVKYIKQDMKNDIPKCNFDVEITMDLLEDFESISGIVLFSGDSDFYAPLKKLKQKDKKVYIIGVRGQTSKELFKVCSKFINFTTFYKGRKKYTK